MGTLSPLKLFRLVHFYDGILRKRLTIPFEIVRRLRKDGKRLYQISVGLEAILLGQ